MTSADSLRQVLLRSSHSVLKASRGKSTIFPVIYPPHLHREFRIAWGFSLCCNLTHSHMPDAVPVRRTNGLPRASFRFHLTMDTLAFGYALGAIPCARDFHPLDCAHAWHTTIGRPSTGGRFAYLLWLSQRLHQARSILSETPSPAFSKNCSRSTAVSFAFSSPLTSRIGRPSCIMMRRLP